MMTKYPRRGVKLNPELKIKNHLLATMGTSLTIILSKMIEHNVYKHFYLKKNTNSNTSTKNTQKGYM